MQAGGMTMGRRGACAGGTGSVGLGHPGGGSKKQAASHSAVRMLGVPKRELRESRACAASDAAAVHMARAASTWPGGCRWQPWCPVLRPAGLPRGMLGA